MTRPLRLEYAGALYHVTSRGDRREDIYLDADDRKEWLQVLGRAFLVVLLSKVFVWHYN